MLLGTGLVAGAIGVIAFPDAARAAPTVFDDTVEIVPPASAVALRLTPSGNVPNSVVTGGALRLDNSGSTGAGAVLCSNRGADALGRLLVVNQMNAANPQHAVRIQNIGTATTVSIYHDPATGAGDPNAEAVDIVSTNAQDTALGVRGRESGKGTVKITHGKPDTPDANASALSIALEGAGTACQGIFIGNDAGNPTTGDLLHIRNGGPGTDRLRLTAAGRLEVARAVSVTATIPTSGADPVSLQAYDASATVVPAAPTNIQSVDGYRSSLTLNGMPGVVQGFVGNTFSSFQHQLRLAPIPGGGTGQLTSVFGFYSSPGARVDAGWNVNNYSPLRVEAPGGSGTILNLTGLDIRDFRGRAAFNFSMRSFGPAVHMRHSGGINIGSQATPDTVLHVRGNPSAHGSVTLDEVSDDPAAPAAGERARLYVKNGKLVVQWNGGGKTLFTTIPLGTSGPYPVTVPVATDTTPP
jgi:hyaluronidase-like protein HylP